MHLKEHFSLLLLHAKVRYINLIEYCRVVFRYYRNHSFCKIDLALLFSYLFQNPYRLSKRFLLKAGESDVYTYGETPLTTLDQIARNCDLNFSDTVIEMGCGRGRTCFWLNQFIGCRVIGIEYVPEFVDKANRIKERFHVKRVEFRLEDFFKADLSEASVIYLYGSCLSSEQIDALIGRFSQLAKGTKIITVSYALTEIDSGAPFEIVKQFSAPFTWGVTTVTLQRKLF